MIRFLKELFGVVVITSMVHAVIGATYEEGKIFLVMLCFNAIIYSITKGVFILRKVKPTLSPSFGFVVFMLIISAVETLRFGAWIIYNAESWSALSMNDKMIAANLFLISLIMAYNIVIECRDYMKNEMEL